MGRSRTFGWADPDITADAVGLHSGLDFLREILAGRLPDPPIASALGMTLEEVEPGRVLFALQPAEEHYNPIGSIHGGVYATLLDSAAACAVHSTLPRGMGYTSLDLTVKFLRPITVATGKIRAVGTVITRGRSTALAQAQLLDSTDRLLAHAVSTCMLLGLPKEENPR